MKTLSILVILLAVFACKSQDSSSPAPSAAQPVVRERTAKIVAFGDSLTAGLGLEAWQTYPAQLQKMLEKDGYKYEVVNAGVSGDTTSGGLRRMDWTIDEDVRIVVLELGGNDILRGQPMELAAQNLGEIIQRLQARKITVVLAGIEAPTNSGPEYRKQVHKTFQDLAHKYNVPFIPFLLVDVIGKPGMIQEDGTHPTALGAKTVAATVYRTVHPLL